MDKCINDTCGATLIKPKDTCCAPEYKISCNCRRQKNGDKLATPPGDKEFVLKVWKYILEREGIARDDN